MKLTFHAHGWEDYLHWQRTDPKMLRKVNGLVKECQRSPFEGTGKPEPLKGDLAGWWSRRLCRAAISPNSPRSATVCPLIAPPPSRVFVPVVKIVS